MLNTCRQSIFITVWRKRMNRSCLDGSTVSLIPLIFILIFGQQLSHVFLLHIDHFINVSQFFIFLLTFRRLIEFVLMAEHMNKIKKQFVYNMGKKIKTCLIGDSSVGKTSILLRVLEGVFKQQTSSTIGADYKSQVRKIKGEDVQVQLWDTSGQDKYRSVAKNFFRGSDGVFIVFSLADDKSLEGLEYWIGQVKEVLDSTVPKILIGNKADLKKEPSPSAQKIIQKLQNQQGYKFYAVSAKTGLNIKVAYQSLLDQAFDFMKSQGVSESIFIPARPPANKKKGCC